MMSAWLGHPWRIAMPMPARAHALLTVALLCGSCTAEEGPADRTTIQLSEIDTLVSESAIAFERAIEVAVSRTGALVYVLDAGATTINVFDSTGQRIGRYGGVGSGPGEFRQPHNLTLLADTLMVIDHGNGRLQFLTTDGSRFGRRRCRPSPTRAPAAFPGKGGYWFPRTDGIA
jgi:hypothetical protein